MADKRKPPESGGGPGRKRAAPTIDLKATEVPPDPAEKKPAAAAPDPQSEPAAKTESAVPEPPPEKPTPPESKPEPKSEPKPEVKSEVKAESKSKPEPESKRAAPPPPPRRLRHVAGWAPA